MATPMHYLDDEKMREEVLGAITDLARLVSITLGPGGRPVLLEQQDGRAPLSTKDGVTVAKHFIGKTPIARVVADAAREVCERTARQAGDGTTTAIVLAAALVRFGQEYLQSNPNMSPQELSRRLGKIFEEKVKKGIQERTVGVKGLSRADSLTTLEHVAKVSANHDIEIAKAVVKGIDMVGEDGMVVAEEGAGAATYVEHREGFPVTTGLKDLGPAACTAFVNRASNSSTQLNGSYVLLFDGDIREAESLVPLMNTIHSEVDERGNPMKTPLIIYAHSYSDPVLKILSQNFKQGRFTCLPLKTMRNGQAHGAQGFLHDLAAYVGGVVLDPMTTPLEQANLSHLGFANTIKALQNETVIESDSEVEDIDKRIGELKEQMTNASEFDKDKLRYRIGQLTGGVATVYAGGVTEFEAKERHARVVDAISATRSAIDMGVVPGGGTTLLSIANTLSSTGAEGIFRKALMVPFTQILKNTGVVGNGDGDGKDLLAISGDIGQHGDTFYVFDALEMKYVDWWEKGIMDPAKVTLTALESALSVSQLLMTLGGIVAMSSTEDEQKIKSMQDGILRAIHQE